jgi:hypothetical protein
MSLIVIGLTALASWGLAGGPGAPPQVDRDSQGKPDAKPGERGEQNLELSHFMRVKLDASGKILEGLAVEDYALIKEGAQKLHTMSTAEKWRVSNDALYRQFSGDFQRVTKELVDAAQQENLDKAALKWMDATMSCIECHRYARGIMIARAQPQQGN